LNLSHQSLEFFKSIFESLGEGLLLFDDSFRVIYSNDAAQNIFGYSKQEFRGSELKLLIPDDLKKIHLGHTESYKKNPHSRAMGIGIELSGKTKSGKSIPIEVSLNYFSKDSTTYVVALITDISERRDIQEKLKHYTRNLELSVNEKTANLKAAVEDLKMQIKERKETERALAESQELYRIIARNFPKGTISVIDKELKYVFIEGQELFRLGITGESLIGTNFGDRLQASIRKSTIEALKPVFKGKSQKIDLKLKKNHYVLNAVPLTDKNKKKADKIMIVEQNVSEQKEAEQNIKNALKKETELGEMKSRFVSMASHEFRTPLSTILSSVFLVEQYSSKGEEKKVREHLKKIRQKVKNLTEILNDILSLGRLEEGKIQIDRSKFDINSFLQEIVSEMKGISKPGQKILTRFDLKRKSVFSDQNILRNILQNLFSNSIKYSPEGATIVLDARMKNGELSIIVEDQGMGIPDEDQGHIFTRFFRAKNASNIQGTGLGLNIVQKYAHILGGSISFRSKEKKGTKFYIHIPVKE
jgi:PAS domain S-box-containing protein